MIVFARRNGHAVVAITSDVKIRSHIENNRQFVHVSRST